MNPPLLLNLFKKGLTFLSLLWILLVFIDGYNQVQNPFFEHDESYQGLQYIASIRLYEGKTLYTDYRTGPSFYPYTPFIPILFSFLMKIWGTSLTVIKTFSYLSGLLTMFFIFLLGWRLNQTLWSALLSVALFASSYVFFDGWWFSARPDNLATTLTLAGFLLLDSHLRVKKSHLKITFSLILIMISALCKQSYILYFPLFLYYLKEEKKRTLITALLPSLIIGVIIWVWFNIGEEQLNLVSSLMGKHPLFPLWAFPLIFNKIFNYLWPWCFLSLFTFFVLSPQYRHWKGLYLASFLLGIISHLKWGGSVNSLLTFSALTAPLLPYAISKIYEFINIKRESLAPLIWGVTFPFLLLPIEPMVSKYLMKPREQSSKLMVPYNFVQNSKDKNILFVRHDYITYLAHGRYYHSDFFNEVFHVTNIPVPPFFKKDICNQYFDAIIGNFFNDELNYIRSLYYDLVTPAPFPSFPLYIKKKSITHKPELSPCYSLPN